MWQKMLQMGSNSESDSELLAWCYCSWYGNTTQRTAKLYRVTEDVTCAEGGAGNLASTITFNKKMTVDALGLLNGRGSDDGRMITITKNGTTVYQQRYAASPVVNQFPLLMDEGESLTISCTQSSNSVVALGNVLFFKGEAPPLV